MKNTSEKLLEIVGLQTHFRTFEGTAKAVNDVSFTLNKGETIAIVGESGSGKSVTALSIMGLLPKGVGKVKDGQILFKGKDLVTISEDQQRKIRGNRISMIFQEPMTSLNPLFTIGDQIAEMFVCHKGMSQKEGLEKAIEMLEHVQIPAPHKRIHEYPHQLSGGMRQRVMIAMALSCNPEILIADEPTTALDVTIQAQVLDLMQDLKKKTNAAIIMITHDLGVVAQMAKKVVVMYAGKVVETGDVFSIFENPQHPYTKALLSSIPKLGQRGRHGRKRLQEISGIVPSLYNLPTGCSYFDRCEHAQPECENNPVPLKMIAPGISVRCTFCA